MLAAAPTTAEVKNLSVNGGLEDGKGKLIIEAQLTGLDAARAKLIFATALQHSIHATLEKLSHAFLVQIDVIQGEPKEIALVLSGEGQVRSVTGDRLLDWSIREEAGGDGFLVLRPKPAETPLTNWLVTVTAETELKDLPQSLTPLTISSRQPGLFQGFARVVVAPALFVAIPNPTGAVPIEDKYLPEQMRKPAALADAEPLAFRLQGAGYALPMTLTPADPEARRVVLRDAKLTGQFTNQTAVFSFTATAQVKDPAGATLALLSGGVALTDLGAHPGWRMKLDDGRFVLVFDKTGEFPITLQFNAAVRQSEGWNAVDFRVAPSALQPLTLQGLAADTQFQFANAARPERKGDTFVSFLPTDGAVRLSWKEARKEEEGKLFFAAGMLSQITISPGLMRQVALLDFKVMQGELSRVTLLLRGTGEVTRVQGDQVLAWRVEDAHTVGSGLPASSDRRLIIQLNQPQKDSFTLQVQMQTPLGAFPQTAQAIRLQPEAATRFSGYFRIVNEGAVRLEVAQASGLSQISPEQFPESDVTRSALRATGSQRFAYRFSSADYALRVQADQIQPELTVSEVLSYHHGQNELTIEAEFELDVREAPLRELLLHIPRGYAIARLNASGMSDYFLREPGSAGVSPASSGDTEETRQRDAGAPSELRIVYGHPVSGRQVVQLRLEHNKPLAETDWALPRVEVTKAKSVRGNVGVSADAGFRLTPGRTQALTEIATAFFPRKVANLQAAFRLSEPAWQATMRVERLPQTVQADGFHLFSIGEGIAYGSSVMNYLISGAPVAAFRVELSDEYFNVEFTGKDVRNWQKTMNGYLVQLHSPVAGAYTLLATYERPFKSQGETLAFTGARPADAQSESGHTLVISAYQFQVKPVEVSSGLLPLETGEVPAEYRLFFDAPILAAYRYTARPFNLRLALSPLEQGKSLDQVVDRASLITRISKEGQVLTDVSYLVKNRGNPNFRLTLPAGVELWSATVNGASIVPVKDKDASLIPLPQHTDPNAVLKLDLKLAAKSASATRVTVTTPKVDAPVMLAEWKLQPDAGQRLAFVKGSLTPVAGLPDVSGFAQLSRLVSGNAAEHAVPSLIMTLVLVIAALIVWLWSSRAGVTKLSAQHVIGTVLGLVAICAAVVALADVFQLADQQRGFLPRDVSFLAPVQQAGSALSVEVANVSEKAASFSIIGSAWPALVALVLFVAGWLAETEWKKSVTQILGWLLLAWVALRFPNGVQWFLVVLVAFLLIHVLIPALRRLWTLPQKPTDDRGAASAVATVLVFGLTLWSASSGALAAAPATKPGMRSPVPDSVVQQARVEDQFVLVTAKVRWPAEKGQFLPLLFEPAVLTQIVYPKTNLTLVQTSEGGKRGQQLIAQQSGAFDIELQYQLQTTQRGAESGFTLPTISGLVNQLNLTVAGLDVDVLSPQAVSVQRELSSSNTVAALVLSPAADTWVGWKPRSRDVKREKPVFFAEISQLYVPSAGVIEGAHLVAIRPAQGELGELILNVPAGATVTDVTDGTNANPQSAIGNRQSLVSLWRFDPDTRKLRVTLTRAQSRPFVLLVRSQVATGPLPFEQLIGLLSVDNAANQIGVLGVATGNEVQLDTVSAGSLSPINLEDFPGDVTQSLAAQIPGLTVRRAFRYLGSSDASSLKVEATPPSPESNSTGDEGVAATAKRRGVASTQLAVHSIRIKASPVEPDVRVETQDTLSLGEDRTVLAANTTVDITRAGIFKLSFVMPPGFDVEAISGAALSHWTESKSDAGRVITLNLKGKTEGRQQFTISLAGPGLKGSPSGAGILPAQGQARGLSHNWAVPQLVLREAGKQQGTLLIVPEQGMQLQATTMDGLSQLDPQKSGIRQKGVLAFRVLQSPWKLALDIEQVDPWIQVTSLQHASVSEAQVKVAANLQYQIENTGLKSLRVALPTNAESVRFTGELVSDFLRVPGTETNGFQQWEVKLQRRFIGSYLLQLTYHTLIAEQATETVLRGVQANDVNLQRGFVTVQTGGRVQVSVDAANAALQPTEWQSIPRALQQNLPAASANFAFRLVEPVFQLPLKLDRHEALRLLPARVNNITFTSVISDAGVMLTQVRLEMLPGDKRLLSVKLPKDARYWFAFVSQNGVWPWRQADEILIPLEQQSRSGKPVPVEIFYSSQVGQPGSRSLDLELFAPKFDLPLENISWRVYLNEKWQVKNWTGTLQLQEQQVTPVAARLDLQSYLQGEAALQRGKTQEAEQMLAFGNEALAKGDPQQARRAFQSAFGLSTHDNAFNEDARVQLHNLKLQQALVGLNVRQAATGGDTGALGGRFRDLRGKDLNYTQQDAKEIIDRNTADDNTATLRLAEKLIQQQDAAVSSAAAIRANIPEQGRVLTFQRAVAVDREADLRIGLRASAVRAASGGMRFLILAGILALLVAFAFVARISRRGAGTA